MRLWVFPSIVVVTLVAVGLLGAYTQTWLLWFGLMFMGLMMFKPEGLVGIWREHVRRGPDRERGAIATAQDGKD